MTDPSPITQRDGVVIVSGDAVLLLYRAVLALAIRHRRDGLASPALLHTLRAELFRATMSPRRHKDARPSTPAPHCDCHDSVYVDSAAAAELLGLSRRSVQRLTGNGLDAVRCGSIWLYRRDAVMTLAKRREASK
jgi:hypothetical protein